MPQRRYVCGCFLSLVILQCHASGQYGIETRVSGVTCIRRKFVNEIIIADAPILFSVIERYATHERAGTHPVAQGSRSGDS